MKGKKRRDSLNTGGGRGEKGGRALRSGPLSLPLQRFELRGGGGRVSTKGGRGEGGERPPGASIFLHLISLLPLPHRCPKLEEEGGREGETVLSARKKGKRGKKKGKSRKPHSPAYEPFTSIPSRTRNRPWQGNEKECPHPGGKEKGKKKKRGNSRDSITSSFYISRQEVGEKDNPKEK